MERKFVMKIAFDRSAPGFWMLYFLTHFVSLLAVLMLVHWLWLMMNEEPYRMDLGEKVFESVVYSLAMTIIRFIRHQISRKQYEKNPVDRRKNNLFRE